MNREFIIRMTKLRRWRSDQAMSRGDRAKGFSAIAKAAIDDGGLSHVDRRVLMALGYFADPHGRCYPSGSKLAATARMTTHLFWKSLKKLKELGYVSVKSRGSKYGTNLYTVHGIAMGTLRVPSISTDRVPKVGTVSVLQTPKNNTHKNTTTDRPSQQAAPVLFSLDANALWFKDNAWSADRVDDLPAVVDRCWHLAGKSNFNAKNLIRDLSRWAANYPDKAQKIRDVGAFYLRRFEKKAREVNRRDAALGGLDAGF